MADNTPTDYVPTAREMFFRTADHIRTARAELGLARDWLNCEWQDMGTPLPEFAGEARQITREAITAARATLDAALDALADVRLYYQAADRRQPTEQPKE